jgi:hypothetical protein
VIQVREGFKDPNRRLGILPDTGAIQETSGGVVCGIKIALLSGEGEIANGARRKIS